MRKFALFLVFLCLIATAAGAATWTPRAPLPAPRCADGAGVAFVNGSIYFVDAGINARYSVAGNLWSLGAPNPRPDGRTNLNSNAVLGTEIIFLGGRSASGGFDVAGVDTYDTVTGAWTLNAGSIFLPNSHAGTVPYGGSIYSFGGTFLGVSSLAFRATPPFSSILVLPSVPGQRLKPAVVQHGGKLWVIGGKDGVPLTSVEVFDPMSMSWTSGPSLPVASIARAAGVANGSLHVLLDAGLYRLSGGSWTAVAPPAPQGSNYAAIFVGDDVHAIGGCTTAHHVLTVGAADIIPPVIASVSASPSVLSVPNHKLVPVTVNVIATDDTDPAPSVHITSVTSNEPDDGLGDGDTPNDIVITGPLTVQLRAERSGKGTGRTYTITVKATDASGNSSSATTQVVVPRGK